ncbi:hypothetical protein GIY62_35110 (plasmid) [Burkholderia plantarii]|uniref:hypothetical protein n=1 Tax=Burkholderia plantarii TaxID=41899 RepID=UPI00272B8E8E|nr:hypothetical protein [Burkholderia plantarii]WLE64096.1 hypothetical protein GIY62_35110 [Burkholderia plantarii]
MTTSGVTLLLSPITIEFFGATYPQARDALPRIVFRLCIDDLDAYRKQYDLNNTRLQNRRGTFIDSQKSRK